MAEETTTSLNVDITQFKKALTEANRYIRMANSEFENATAGTEKWVDSADGLRAKITQLNKTLDGQETAAAALRHEYEKVCAEQGENSAGAQELAIKLNKQEAACKKTAAQIAKYQGKLDDMEAAANDAGNEAKDLDKNLGKTADATKKAEKQASENEKETSKMAAAFKKAAAAAGGLVKGLAGIAAKGVVAGIKGITAASAGLVTAFLATGEAQKENITAMAKLDAAYKSAGHSTQAATKTYEELYGVIGDTDQAVEASQQIALLANSEEDAARWAAQGAGVVGKFGDALQPEAFYEAANETLKLGEATGAYTQMLEQSGMSVKDFNRGLAKCKTQEQKQAYMLAITEQALAGAGDEYRKANAAVIENNKANAKLQETLNGVGKAALPVMTALKLIGASILGDLLPHIQTLGTSFTEALNGSETAAQDMGNAVGAILQNLGQKILQALPSILTIGTSIITSLIQGLVSAAPQLAQGVTQIVQYFIQAAPQLLQAGASMVGALVNAIRTNLPTLLSAGGQMIEQLLSGIVSNIPSILQSAVSAVGGFVQGIQTYLPVVLSKGAELLGKLGEGLRTAIPNLISQGLDIIMNLVTSLYDAAPTIINIGFDLISNLVSGLLSALPTLIEKGPEIISKFANTLNDNIPQLLSRGWELIKQIVSGILQAIPTLVSNIPKIITAIVDVWQAFNWLQLGKNAITFLGNGIKSMFGAIKTAGTNILNGVTGAIQALPGKLLQLGKNAITFLRNGISSMIGAVKAAGGNVLTAIASAIQALPGKLLAFGKSAITSLGNAIQTGVSLLKSKATAVANSIVSAVNALPGKMLSIGRNIVEGIGNGIVNATSWLIGKIQQLCNGALDAIKAFFKIGSPSKLMRDEIGRWLPAGIGVGVEKYGKVANKAMVNMAKDAVSAANAEFNGSSLNLPGVNGTPGAPGTGGRGGAVYNFYQYNTSPKPLSRRDVYRQTKNALKFATSNA